MKQSMPAFAVNCRVGVFAHRVSRIEQRWADTPTLHCLSHHRRGGFTFTEVLFAMMILGIGFIMVAAMFPVAIRETQETVQETTGASVARTGASYIGRITNYVATLNPGTGAVISNTTYFPVTNNVVVNYTGPAPGVATPPNPQLNAAPFWQALSGNLILQTDTRYGWVPFYSRALLPSGLPSPYAQVTVIAVQCRNTSTFSSYDTVGLPVGVGTNPPNLQGRPLIAFFTANAAGTPDQVFFQSDGSPFTASPGPSNLGAVAPGCFLIIADDHLGAYNVGATPPSCNGYVYRVGNQAPNAAGTLIANTFELMPGNDLKNSRNAPTNNSSNLPPVTYPSAQSPPIRVFIVGKGYADPTKGQTQFTGPAMDIEAYSTFIRVQ